MEPVEGQQWYLRKHEDGAIFGPLDFAQLSRWAYTAQIAPHDCVSTDGATWMKAPMLAELGMDWLVEVTTEHFYGPTTLAAVFEFARAGEISPETFVINTCDGSRRQLAELEPPPVDLVPADSGGVADDASATVPGASGIEIGYEARVRDLEQSLREERRALRESEQRYAQLESRYRELLEQTASDGTLR